MNNLTRLQGVVCLGVLLVSPSVAADYLTALDQAVWRYRGDAARCIMEHQIADVAVARFSAKPNGALSMDVDWLSKGIQGGQATLSVIPAPWQQADAVPLAHASWRQQRLHFTQQVPEALNALADGRWLALDEAGNPHQLVMSSIHFQQAYSDFRLCRGEASVEQTLDGQRLTLHFKVGSQQLSPAQRQQLQTLAARLTSDARISSLLIESFTDNRGKAELNLRLSRMRAEQVADQLRGTLPTLPMDIRAYGEASPLTDNDTPAGRYQNRRVTITLIQAEQAS
ncbi:MAG: OmpA family protein [Oceanisphaera sp.]|nr:OmpA family protein [Oceanisphaera sp.]